MQGAPSVPENPKVGPYPAGKETGQHAEVCTLTLKVRAGRGLEAIWEHLT